MASLQFTVFDAAGSTGAGPVLQEGVIAIGATSAQGSEITPGAVYTRIVRVTADADCWVTWGTSPTALNDGSEGRMFHASQVEYFQVAAGERFAVIERA
jgi:hypothetical protein